MKDRSDWVDYAKGVGIVLVVYGHVARGVHRATLSVNEGLFRLVDSIIYSFHMPLFFFLSGLFFFGSLKRYGTRGLIAAKFDSILYPYFVWSLLQGCIEVLMSRYTNGDARLGEVLQLLWHPRAQFWFLYALFFIFVGLAWAGRKFGGHWAVAATVIALGLYFVSTAVPRTAEIIFGFAIFFVAGIWFGRVAHKFQRFAGLYSLLFAAMFVIGQYWFHVWLGLTYENRGLFALILAVISIMFIVTLCMFIGRWRIRWLAMLGVSSMTIYLLHILAGSGTRILLNIFGLESTATNMVFGVVVGLGAPIVAGRMLKRAGVNFFFLPPAWASAQKLLGNRLQRAQAATN